MPDLIRVPIQWLLAPATDDVPRQQVWAGVVLRLVLGLMWLHNVWWKIPPSFGSETSGLRRWIGEGEEHSILPPYRWLTEHVLLPNMEIFGWGVLLAETALAVMLLTGAWVRLAGALGVAQSAAIALSVAAAPGEWPWAYWLMIGGHLVILFSAAGRALAVDAVRAGVDSGARLGQVWGGVGVVVAAYAAVYAVEDPTAAAGHYVRWSDAAVSVGRFNLIGAIGLLAAGALLVAAARTRMAALGWAAAAVGVLAALSLYAQIGFTDPLLGGNATSAAFFVSLAVVGAFVVPRKEPAQ